MVSRVSLLAFLKGLNKICKIKFFESVLVTSNWDIKVAEENFKAYKVKIYF